MVKFPEANARLFKDIFVCRKCKSKMRTNNMKVLAGIVRCRKCKYGSLRPKKKK